ncbi:MAG: hypothetical protein IKS63_03440, partial [Firmicutes bacterium]|nr:hypothetical protein [Bacillota bacterium]
MKKTLSIILMLFLSLTLVVTMPAGVTFADDSGGGTGSETVSFDPLLRIPFTDLYKTGQFTIPEDIPKASVKADKVSGGLMITLSGNDIQTGLFTLTDELDFSDKTIGRISFDGLADRKVDAEVSVFLDDADTPLTTFTLKRKPGNSAWTAKGDITQDVLKKGITGSHRVSFSIKASAPEETENMKVLIRSIEFSENALPVLYFDIDESDSNPTIKEMNSDENHHTECYGNVTLQIPPGYEAEYTDDVLKTKTYELDYIRGRGNTTWWANKKPYKLALEIKANLLGMCKNRH